MPTPKNTTITYDASDKLIGTKSSVVGTIGTYQKKDGSTYTQLTSDHAKFATKANGTLFANQEIDNIDEIGKELVIPSGRLRMMEYGDAILPHGISENLLKWGTMNPALLSTSTPDKVNNITNTDRSLHYNIENINLSEVQNGREFIGDLNRYLQRTNTLNY